MLNYHRIMNKATETARLAGGTRRVRAAAGRENVRLAVPPPPPSVADADAGFRAVRNAVPDGTAAGSPRLFLFFRLEVPRNRTGCFCGKTKQNPRTNRKGKKQWT